MQQSIRETKNSYDVIQKDPNNTGNFLRIEKYYFNNLNRTYQNDHLFSRY